MKNLKIAQKLALIAGLFLLPIGLLFYLMVSGMNSNVLFARKEVAGNQYQAALEALIQSLVEYRWARLDSAEAAKQPADPDDSALSQRIDQQFLDLLAVDQQLSTLLQTTPADLSRRGRSALAPALLQQQWQALKEASPADQETQSAALIANLFALVAHVGDTSNLILDPDLDSYYMMDLTLLAAPQMQNRIQATLAYTLPILRRAHNSGAKNGAATLGGAISTAERIQLANYASLLAESDLKRIQNSAQVAINEDANFYGLSPDLQDQLPPAEQQLTPAVQSLIDQLNQIVASSDATASTGATASAGAATDPVTPEAFQASARQALDQSFTFWGVARRNLDSLLARRIAAFITQRTFNILFTVTCLLLSILGMALVTRSILRPLHQVTAAAIYLAQSALPPMKDNIQAIAAGDLTIRLTLEANQIQTHSRDELGEVAGSFNQIVLALSDIKDHLNGLAGILQTQMSGLAENAALVKQSIEQINQASTENSQATGQITATLQNVSSGIQNQAQSINRSAAAMDELTRLSQDLARAAARQADGFLQAEQLTDRLITTIQQVAQHAAQTRTNTQQTSQAVDASADTIRQTIASIHAIHQRLEGTVQKMDAMQKTSQEMSQIVSTIAGIAEQTNLLALNAAIEAARAGDKGKGFAVVADEVRKLAENSASSARQVYDLLARVQKEITIAADDLATGAQEVEQNAAFAGQAEAALGHILQAVTTVDQLSEQTAVSTADMTRIAQTLREAMSETASSVEVNRAAAGSAASAANEIAHTVEDIAAVSQQNSAAFAAVSESANQIDLRSRDMSGFLRELDSMVRDLNQMVEQFRV